MPRQLVMPGLAAAVDQHAAAVRDGVLAGYGATALTERALLAGYGRGLLARAGVSTKQLRNEAAGRWRQADWLTLRLLAVCALAGRARAGHARAGRSWTGRPSGTEVTTTAPRGAASPSGTDLRELDAWWRAANYLSVGQIYLLDNPLLREPLQPEHIKPRLLGHWGTTPGSDLPLGAPEPGDRRARPRRAVRHRAGPRRPGAWWRTPGWRAPTPSGTRDVAATPRGCASCSGSSPSPAASPATPRRRRPGSIHEGGELGYSLSHAYGAAFDNPDLLVACVIGDGEAETGPLAASLARQQVPRPGRRRRRAADPAPQRLQDRQPDGAGPDPARTSCCRLLRRATATSPYVVEGGFDGEDPMAVARADGRGAGRDRRRDRRDPAPRAEQRRRRGDAAALADARAAHARRAGPGPTRWTACRSRARGGPTRCRWPRCGTTPSTWPSWRRGCGRTGPEELFDGDGPAAPGAARAGPAGARRMSANPHANGGELLRDLRLPDFTRLRRRRARARARRRSAADRACSGTGCATSSAPTRTTSGSFGPDETASNRLQAVFEVTDRQFVGEIGADRRAPAPRRPGDGGAVRAPVPGLAGGLPAHRPARAVQLLRGVHPHRRLDVQPARQVAEGQPATSRGGGRSRR